MNADDEKKLRDMCSTDIVPFSDYAYAYALGRARGMTEAAGICRAIGRAATSYAAEQIAKARDA